jgi:signal transduction protein with GAF and PtsI domain
MNPKTLKEKAVGKLSSAEFSKALDNTKEGKALKATVERLSEKARKRLADPDDKEAHAIAAIWQKWADAEKHVIKIQSYIDSLNPAQFTLKQLVKFDGLCAGLPTLDHIGMLFVFQQLANLKIKPPMLASHLMQKPDMRSIARKLRKHKHTLTKAKIEFAITNRQGRDKVTDVYERLATENGISARMVQRIRNGT